MNIHLLSIGNEVVDGFTINTNASFLARTLVSAGYCISGHHVIRDEPETITEALLGHECIIATGGLGPTLDDLTEDVAERALGKPTGEFLNAIGTAPGLIYEREKQTIIFLPGVPKEMEVMCVDELLPFLKKRFTAELIPRKIVQIMRTNESDIDPFLRTLKNVKIGIYPGFDVLTLHLLGEWEPAYQKIKEKYGNRFFEEESLESALQKAFVDRGWTLSLAESCTGGALAEQLTRLPGASEYFLGSIVSYANSLKESVLGVSSHSLQTFGAVSKEVVEEMGLGALALTGSDFSLAVSGIAGPTGGTEEKPVGMIWCALCEKGKPSKLWKLELLGNREVVIKKCVNALLIELLMRIR